MEGGEYQDSLQLSIAQDAFQECYEDFREHLKYEEILADLVQEDIITIPFLEDLISQDDRRKAACLLLDQISRQDVPGLRKLIRVLRSSSQKREDHGVRHRLLADKLEESIDKRESVTGCTLIPNHKGRSSTASSIEKNLVEGPGPVELKEPLVPPVATESTCIDLVGALQFLFLDNNSDHRSRAASDEESTSTQPPHVKYLKIAKCSIEGTSPVCPSMPLLGLTGVLKGKLHADLVILLWKLGGTDPKHTNLAHSLIKCRSDLPLDLQIVNILGSVYASPETAPIFHEGLKMCDSPSCLNSVILRCRLHYLLHLCYRSSDEPLAKEHLATSSQLASMTENDFTMPFIKLAEALKELAEYRKNTKTSNPLKIVSLSSKAYEMSLSLPEWTKPFSMVIKLHKMLMDCKIGLLALKLGDSVGALSTASSVNTLLVEFENPATLSQLIPRQMATLHFVWAITQYILGRRTDAEHNAKTAHMLYTNVLSLSEAREVMAFVEDHL